MIQEVQSVLYKSVNQKYVIIFFSFYLDSLQPFS